MSTERRLRVLAGRATDFPSSMQEIFIGPLLTRMQRIQRGREHGPWSQCGRVAGKTHELQYIVIIAVTQEWGHHPRGGVGEPTEGWAELSYCELAIAKRAVQRDGHREPAGKVALEGPWQRHLQAQRGS